jgi:hypothetical protein
LENDPLDLKKIEEVKIHPTYLTDTSNEFLKDRNEDCAWPRMREKLCQYGRIGKGAAQVTSKICCGGLIADRLSSLSCHFVVLVIHEPLACTLVSSCNPVVSLLPLTFTMSQVRQATIPMLS